MKRLDHNSFHWPDTPDEIEAGDFEGNPLALRWAVDQLMQNHQQDLEKKQKVME